MVLITGLIAGSYPAVVLSGFKPIETLRNRLKLSGSNVFTKTLVVIQFGLSVFLIISTLIMWRQMEFTRTKDMGFNKDQLVVVNTNGLDGRVVAKRFRERLGSSRNVPGVTAAGTTLGYRGTIGTMFFHEGEYRLININSVETDYLDVMGIELATGRNFDPNLATDSSQSAIVNEALVREYQMTDPIGSLVPGFDDGEAPTIIGVVRDYNFQVLYQDVGAVMLTMDDFFGLEYVFVRISNQNIPETIAALQQTWMDFAPDVPLQYNFLDDDMQALYQSDRRWSRIVSYASFLAILIACLGLFGLIALSVAGRRKEIGIRKVLGAPVRSIMLLLSKDFLGLVLIGVILASPVAYIVMQRWLNTFAFRINMGGDVFILAAVAALLIAFSTLSYRTIKAAVMNPVDSIRYE